MTLPARVTVHDLWKEQQQKQQQEETNASLGRHSCCLSLNNHHSPFGVTCPVTELVGPAGSGKSQLVAHLSLEAAASSKNGYAIILALGSTAQPLHISKRLQQLLSSHHDDDDNNSSDNNNSNNNNILSRILIRTALTPEDFLQVLREQLPLLLKQHNVRLICMDSIANIFRNHEDIIQRTKLLFQVAALLQQYSIPSIIVNQVSGNEHRAALGLAWSHCVRSRYVLHHNTLTLTKSPSFATPQSLRYTIQTTGVHVATEVEYLGSPRRTATRAISTLEVPTDPTRPTTEPKVSSYKFYFHKMSNQSCDYCATTNMNEVDRYTFIAETILVIGAFIGILLTTIHITLVVTLGGGFLAVQLPCILLFATTAWALYAGIVKCLQLSAGNTDTPGWAMWYGGGILLGSSSARAMMVAALLPPTTATTVVLVSFAALYAVLVYYLVVDEHHSLLQEENHTEEGNEYKLIQEEEVEV